MRKVECDDILKKLRSLSNPKVVEGMAKYVMSSLKGWVCRKIFVFGILVS